MPRPRSYDVSANFREEPALQMRGVAAILTFVFLAACADGGPPSLPGDQIRVRFPAGGVADVIEIDAVNRLPLRKVELVAADGQTTPASYLNVSASPSATSYEGWRT